MIKINSSSKFYFKFLEICGNKVLVGSRIINFLKLAFT